MSRLRILGYPLTGRAGLGNLLFPWARCYLWCLDNRLPMIAPFWAHLRLGPYLRRDNDKRAYQCLFRHRGYHSGLERLFVLATYRRFAESEKGSALMNSNPARAIVVFKGMEGLFEGLRSRSADVAAELKRITRRRFLPAGLTRQSFLGIHVRLGDFSVPGNDSVLRHGGVNYRIPIQWYADILHSLRISLGIRVPALVFSDGSEADLRELLDASDVTLFRGGTAITDLLTLSQSAAIIASGSTFSMWASYLGQVPTVWYPGQRKQCVLNWGDSAHLEPEMEAEVVPHADFIEVVRGRL